MADRMNILVFDTSTTACTVALKVGQKIFSRHKEEANIHSLALLEMIDSVLLEAKIQLNALDYLAVGVGPGSFTGLRIGIGVAQSLAYSNNIRLIPISSLEMIALNAVSLITLENNDLNNEHTILVAHDARMSEVYSALFQYKINKRLVLVGDLTLEAPGGMVFNKTETQGNIYCGNAWQEYAERFPKHCLNSVVNVPHFPDAKTTVQYVSENLKQFSGVGWLELEPTYVRNDVAKKSQKKL